MYKHLTQGIKYASFLITTAKRINFNLERKKNLLFDE